MTCPKRYFLRYELGAQADFRPAALALGTVFHQVVGRWLRFGSPIAELEYIFRQRLAAELRDHGLVLFDYEDETEEKFTQRAVGALRAFVTGVPRPPHVLGIEVPFSLELVDARTGEVLGLPVIGALDAVTQDDNGKRRVLEIKTAAKRWSNDDVDSDMQTTTYKTAARTLGHGEVALRLLVAVKTSTPATQVLDVDRSRADEAELVELFLSVHRAIDAGVDHRVRSWRCRSCPFAGACR
jgi:hypothetical protein